MTSEEMVDEYLDYFGYSKSNRATAKAALMYVLYGQRKICADAVSKVHTSSRSDPTDTPYVDACLNATGEDK